jgi:hypothetical protein
MCDTECYRNYWLCKFYDPVFKQFHKVEFQQGQVLDTARLKNFIANATLVTFNGNKYDVPMIQAALAGFTTDMLKNLSDSIIKFKLQPWQALRDFGLSYVDDSFFDVIDLIEVAPGTANLKIYGGRLHTKKMQDLPIDVDAILTQGNMVDIDQYCGNDLLTTLDLFVALKSDLETRYELSDQYSVDLRSKSDAQIAEAAFKKLLPFKVDVPFIQPGTVFQYDVPSCIRFTTVELLATLERVKSARFTIGMDGSPKMPPELDDHYVKLGDSVYRMGIGGLHSSEQSVYHVADANYCLLDVDGDSFYPMIMSTLELYPPQIGPIFLEIYNGWIKTRLKYKNTGAKKKAATFKIKINGTYGKTGSKYSILYAPKLLIQTTITGQLMLLMLIEMLETSGIRVISANTDGIVIKAMYTQIPLRDAIVEEWEQRTKIQTSSTHYKAIFFRDVNCYMAFKPDGEVKAKNALGNAGLAKNPQNEICNDAVQAYLLNGTPLLQTITECKDIRKFVTVRAVQGGGNWVQGVVPPDGIRAQRDWLAQRGWSLNADKTHDNVKLNRYGCSLTMAVAIEFEALPKTYLGKAVRFYHAVNQPGYIGYQSSGKMVATSENCKPVMDLPNDFPTDIDYDWYTRAAHEILNDIGVKA